MGNYYNEINPFMAAWLRELIKAGLITPGEVDERSIKDVGPGDLKRFTQCHFFAGIGVWSHALRAAGWPDDTPVWTGSCPCQSFSASGKRGGFSDQRHLWPAWFRLIRECAPNTIFGEQVASRDGLAWFDLVSSDLEGAGYAVGASDLCAAGFGAPHIRQRLYFVADTLSKRARPKYSNASKPNCDKPENGILGQNRRAGILAHTAIPRRAGARQHDGGPSSLPSRPEQCGGDGELGNASEPGLEERPGQRSDDEEELAAIERAGGGGVVEPKSDGRREGRPKPGRQQGRPDAAIPGFTNGFWRVAEWLPCRDGKARSVEPGTFPLAHGAAKRVGRLRGYGNALCAPVTEAFIRAYIMGQK